jgi:hypothetical protein
LDYLGRLGQNKIEKAPQEEETDRRSYRLKGIANRIKRHKEIRKWNKGWADDIQYSIIGKILIIGNKMAPGSKDAAKPSQPIV